MNSENLSFSKVGEIHTPHTHTVYKTNGERIKPRKRTSQHLEGPSQSCCRPDAEAAAAHPCALTTRACALESALLYCSGASYKRLVFRFFCDLFLLRYGHHRARGVRHCENHGSPPHRRRVRVQEPRWTLLQASPSVSRNTSATVS